VNRHTYIHMYMNTCSYAVAYINGGTKFLSKQMSMTRKISLIKL